MQNTASARRRPSHKAIQCHYGLLSLSHPDNSVPANPLVTPAHIVPEWYFLVQYSILKCIPNKNTGFLGLVTSITFLFLLTESRNVTTLTSMSTPIASLSLNFLFLITLVFFYIGAQAPTPIYISTARVLTVYYYLLLHCILLTHCKNTFLLFIYSCRLGDCGLGDLRSPHAQAPKARGVPSVRVTYHQAVIGALGQKSHKNPWCE